MSLINGRNITDGTVSGADIKLANNQTLKARNAADSGDVDILKVNTSDAPEMSSFFLTPASAPTTNYQTANKKYVDDQIAAISDVDPVWNKENKTLNGTDITNQYVDLAQLIKASSLDVVFNGLVQVEGTDYTLSTFGGVTRVTFAGDLATGGASELISGDKLHFKYQY